MKHTPPPVERMLDKRWVTEGVRVLRHDYGHAFVKCPSSGEEFWTPLADLIPVLPVTRKKRTP